MKAKRLLLSFFFVVVVGIIITARSGGPAAQLGAGYTGAPGEGNCSSCHFGGSYGTVTPVIEIFQVGTSTAVTAYTAGTQYDMRVTVNNSAGTPIRRGFQMTTLRVSNNQALAGYSNLGAGVQQAVAGGRTYVEHSSPSVSNQFTFRWTAPASGTGSVRFYASGNCVNNNGGSDGDIAGTANLILPEIVPLAVSGTKVDVTCFGLNNGSINITASGGSLPYSYLWSDGAITEDRTNLAPGTYSVTVTDAALSTVTSSNFTIAQPAAPLVITVNVGAIACAGGSASVTVGATGGTPNYTGTGVFNLAPGQHTRTVTDSKGCIKDTTFTIGPAPAAITVNAVANGLIPCNGNGTTVTVTASGGTGTLNGVGTFTVTIPGTQQYTVTDANGCSGQASVNVSSVSGLAVTTGLTMPNCIDTCSGVLTYNIQTTSLPFTESVTSQLGGNQANANALCPGNYLLAVEDNAGCEFTWAFTILAPTPPQATIAQVNNANGGNNGSVDITVTGGVPPYTYEWSNNASSQDLSNVGAGTYSVVVTDSNDCTAEITNIQVFDIAGIEEPKVETVVLYPNPFSGQFQLNLPGVDVVSVKDVSGKTHPFIQNGQAVRLLEPAKGIYFIELKSNNVILVMKLLSE